MTRAGEPSLEAAPRELALLVGAGGGEPETLVLVGVPHDGRVAVRRWSSADPAGTTEVRTEDAATFLRWVEDQAVRGRTLNQALYAVRLWLRGEGTAPRTR